MGRYGKFKELGGHGACGRLVPMRLSVIAQPNDGGCVGALLTRYAIRVRRICCQPLGRLGLGLAALQDLRLPRRSKCMRHIPHQNLLYCHLAIGLLSEINFDGGAHGAPKNLKRRMVAVTAPIRNHRIGIW